MRTYATMSQNSSVSSSVMVNGNGTRSASGIQSQSSPASTACVYYCEIVGGCGRCVCDDIFKKRGSAATHVRCKMSSILALDRFDRGYKWVLYRRTFPLGLGCGALPSILERTKSRWLGSSGGRVGFCYLPCSRTVASSHGC